MKFKTLRTSETGKKFEALQVKLTTCQQETIKLMNELGAEEWRLGYWRILSGVSAIFFPKGYDVPKYYKKVKDGGYLPRLNTKKGKEINAQLKALPSVTIPELNDCVGFENNFKHIGYSFSNPKYFLFSTSDKWNFTPPEDCTEITVTEFKQLSKDD